MVAPAIDAIERKVLRLHLRSTIEHVNHGEQEDFCLKEHGSAGVGWGCWGDPRAVLSWSDYQAIKRQSGEGVNASVRRLHNAPVGTLVWSRRRDGSYWLGELTGHWEYRGDEQARRLDLFNLRPCRWWLVGTEDVVPGKVVNNFRAPVTVNPVSDLVAVRYTSRVWRQLSGRSAEIERLDPLDVITSLLSPEDVEDLVAVFLQDQYDLVLVSRGACTPGYEFVMRHRRTGRRAIASVKTGDTPVDLDILPGAEDIEAFVYSTSGRLQGHRSTNVREISTCELVEFVARRGMLLPDRVARWLD